jgi:hypothetical protein
MFLIFIEARALRPAWVYRNWVAYEFVHLGEGLELGYVVKLMDLHFILMEFSISFQKDKMTICVLFFCDNKLEVFVNLI